MITVTVSIVDSEGSEVNVCHSYEGMLLDKTLDEIETLVCSIKKDTMQASEQSLLYLNQEANKKK